MSASQPEADAEYSRGQVPSEGPGGALGGTFSGRSAVTLGALALVLIAGAGALVVAELTALIRVRTQAGHHVVRTISAGSHHSFALLPIAALATAIAVSLLVGARLGDGWTAAQRAPMMVAVIALGLVALGIALLGDLPDIHRTGLLGTPQTGLRDAESVAGPALYLETAGAIALLAAGGLGLLLGADLTSRQRPRTPCTSRGKSGS